MLCYIPSVYAPLPLHLSVPNLFKDKPVTFTIHSGILVLLGPNGSGKSQVMRRMTQQWSDQGLLTLMLTAGRLQPLESRRMIYSHIWGGVDPTVQSETAITLDPQYKLKWHQIESVMGVLNRLSERLDIQIKVGERLRALFGRGLRLVWDRGNLKLEFARGGAAYEAFRQAATHHARDVTGLFEIARVDELEGPEVEVRLMALVLDVSGFPIRVGKDDNINQVAQGRIKNRS